MMRLELATELARLAAPIYAALMAEECATNPVYAQSSSCRRATMTLAIAHAAELRRACLEFRDG
jgi:hypothetical protein